MDTSGNIVRKIFSVLVFYIFLSAAVSAEQNNILVLHSYHDDLPWTVNFKKGLARAQEQCPDFQFFYEYMDALRLSSPLGEDDWAYYLNQKYRSVKIDGLIAESYDASAFLNRYRESLPQAPAVMSVNSELPVKPETLYLTANYTEAFDETFRTAVRQNPKRRKVVIINGGRVADRVLIERYKTLSEANEIEYEIIENFTIDELLYKVEMLSGDEIVFYSLVMSDKTGKSSIPREVLGRICRVSPSPVYSFWSVLLGTGIVGGVMVDGATIAEEMVKGLEDYFRDGRFGEGYRSTRLYVDWNTIDKFDLSMPAEDEGVTYINRPVPFFTLHYKEIITFVLFISLLFFLVTFGFLVKIKKQNIELTIARANEENARKNAEELATHDQLTELLNRRAITAIINYEMNRFARTHSSVSMIFADIDYFKSINDNYGHHKGDEVLKKVADMFVSVCRKTDQVARWGGEEFLILCSDTPENNAAVLAEKLRSHAEVLAVEGIPNFTMSFGVGELADNSDFKKWYRQVDAALYRSKARGRNKVTLVSGMSEDFSR